MNEIFLAQTMEPSYLVAPYATHSPARVCIVNLT